MQAEIDAALGIIAAFAVILGAGLIVAGITWLAWSGLHRGDDE